jgi:PAS domain S-box-containing protein
MENNEPVSLYGVFQDISEEVGMREELSQREELYRLISENTSDLICLQTPDLQYTYVSPSLQSMLGYAPKAWIDKKVAKYIHPDDRERVIRVLSSSASGSGKTVKLEYRIKKNKGDYIWVETVSKPVSVDGYLVSIQTATRDITDRKEKERAIVENEANLKALVENSTDFIWSIDKEYRYITFNSVFREAVIAQTGMTPKTGERWHLEMLPKKLANYWMPLYERAFSGERFIAESKAVVRGVKRSYENSFNPILNKAGEVTGVAVFSRDVTEKQKERDKRKKFQQGLRLLNSLALQKEEHFDDLMLRSLALVAKFLRLPLGILSRIEGNDYFIHGFYSRAEEGGLEIGQRFDLEGTYCDITYQKSRVIAIEDMKTSEFSGHPCFQNFQLGTYIGAIVMVKNKRFGTVNFSDGKSRKDPFDKYDREFLQLFANWIGAEIEQRQNEEHLKSAKEKAESASVAKENFLSTISHEIRTPLNAIIGMTHILLDEKPRKDQQENLELVKFSSENLLVLVNDVLDYNKIAANKLVIDEHPFNIKNLFQSIKGSNQFKVQEKGVVFKLYYDDDIPTVVIGDGPRLAQVINNLVSNAIKFTEKGNIKLFVELREAVDDLVTLEVAVEDTGIGIDKKKHKAIFDRFTQAESSTSRKFGGTGLGLSITKKLLELMGSAIQMESKIGKGSRFWFTLTLKKEKTGSKEAKAIVHTDFKDLSKHNIKVLVAEDNRANQLVVSKFLEKWGVKTEFAINGVEAIKKVKKKGYHMMLMDLQMPEMDGFEATRQIRAMKADYFSKLPIIALTASVMNNVKSRAVEMGMNDFITKPFAPIDLYNMISRYSLGERSSPAKLANGQTNGQKKKARRDYATIMEEFTMGDPSFKKELAERYVSNLAELRDEFPVLLKENQTKALRELAHKVKFTLHSLEAKEIAEYVERAQELAETVNSEDVIGAFTNEFQTSCDQVIKALKAIESAD